MAEKKTFASLPTDFLKDLIEIRIERAKLKHLKN